MHVRLELRTSVDQRSDREEKRLSLGLKNTCPWRLGECRVFM